MMKKLICVISIILCGAFLCSCAVKLPGSMTEEKTTQSAAAIINLLNNKDYEAFDKTCEQVLVDAFANASLSDAWEPFYTEAGNFEKVEKTELQSSKGYAVAIVQAKYANKTVVFTLSFNTEYQLAGIYFK